MRIIACLQSKTRSQSSAPPPPPATSVSSPQPSPHAVIVRGLILRMGFELLSEASLRALSLAARFLVVLTVAASLREFKALSSVLPFLGSDTSLAYVPQFGAR